MVNGCLVTVSAALRGKSGALIERGKIVSGLGHVRLLCGVAVFVVGAPVVATSPPSGDSVPGSEVAVPLCANQPVPNWVTNARQPNDGTPDPDGRIVFGAGPHEHEMWGQIVSLYAIDPDGSDLVALPDCGMARPRFSPDGTRLALSVLMDDGRLQVATMNVDGTDLRVLTSGPGSNEIPDWSPDGSWLVYSHIAPDCIDPDCAITSETLWRMDADGANARQIGASEVYDWEPKLSPDGTEVL